MYQVEQNERGKHMGPESLAGPAVTIIDKAIGAFSRGRPTLELVPERFLGGANVFMHLAVTNTDGHGIHVKRISVRPALVQVWRDSSAEAAADAMVGEEPEFILAAGERRFLPILAVDRREEHADHLVQIRLHWRSLRHPRRWKFPVALTLTHREFDQIAGAA